LLVLVKETVTNTNLHLQKDIARQLQEIIFDLVTEHGWKLIAIEVQPDHVHFFIATAKVVRT
jgi:REP element-mobilizing transposase RayT